MSRPAATLVLVVYLAMVALVAVTARAAAPEPRRTVGYGQTHFNGLGPERWAARYRAERRAAVRLRALLAGRLERLLSIVRGFECIHEREGSWTDRGAPYWGGLQMDLGFQRAYGRELLASKGTADHWTPAEQIAVAIRAHATRGWNPWPNTARSCGLIR